MPTSPNAVSTQELDAAAAAAGVLGPHEVTREVVDIRSADGVSLAADVFHPAHVPTSPALLMRTAYGRAGFSALGVYYASHGYRCVLQDTRGTSSYFHEQADGGAAAAWIASQPWYDGALGLFGTSYMGFTAYATAATRPEGLRAIALSAYSADRTSAWYPGGSFGLDLALAWSAAQAATDASAASDASDAGPFLDIDTRPPAENPMFLTLPLSRADQAFSGQSLPFYQERLRFGGDDPHWAPLDFSSLLDDGTLPPMLLIDGWYDYHRPYLWADFLRLRANRGGDRIVVGPWGHGVDPIRSNVETLAWFERHLRPAVADGAAAAPAPSPVAIHVNPDLGWRELPAWPAPGTRPHRLHLAPGGALQPDEPATVTGSVDRFTYDPADPTPAVALASFAPVEALAEADNRPLEAREDVLTYTSDELDAPLTLIGGVTVQLWVNSSTQYTDFYARITDVHPDGRSLAIAQTLLRLDDSELTAPDAPVAIELDLGQVAHQLAQGHRLRLQISSGAHPFYARNLGTGEPIATGTAMVVAYQAIHYGSAAHPSAITVRIEA